MKANNANTTSYPPLSRDLHTGSGIGASSWFHQSHLLPMLLLLLRHRGCLFDITGALFCSPGTFCGWFPVSPFLLLCVVSTGLFACFCHKMTFSLPGEYDHSVLYTTAQLTEGRSPGINPSSRQQKKGNFLEKLLRKQRLCST